jgi:hypothetical protein
MQRMNCDALKLHKTCQWILAQKVNAHFARESNQKGLFQPQA